jgi:ABC-type multidrug transport system fused ATPase/permease subunit
LGDVIQPFLVYERLRDIPSMKSQAEVKLRDGVVTAVTWLGIIGALSMVAAYLLQATFSYAGERQARRLRLKFIQSVMSQDLAWFDKNRAGDLTTSLTSDTLLFQDGVSEKVSLAVSYVVQFIAGFTIAFIENWSITLVLLATIPLFGLSGVIVGKAIADGTSSSQSVYAQAGAVAQETLSNIRTVTAFGNQQRFYQKFSNLLQKTVQVNERKSWISGAGFGTFFGLLYGLFALGFWYGAKLIVDTSGKPAAERVDGENVLVCYTPRLYILQESFSW